MSDNQRPRLWNDAYMLGDDQIDQQHKQLVWELDDLTKCVKQDDDIRIRQCKQTMDFLKSFARIHFSAEEMLMERVHYPLLSEHRSMHDSFRRSVHELELSLIQNHYDEATVQEVIHVVMHWWLFHIIKEDKKIKEYLPKKAQGE